MKASELREKSVSELNEQLNGLYRDQFNYRIQKRTGELAQTHVLSAVKQDIARIKTIITEKQKSGS